MFVSAKKLQEVIESSFRRALANGSDDKARIIDLQQEKLRLQDELIDLKDHKANARRNLADEIADTRRTVLDDNAAERRNLESELEKTKREMADNKLEIEFLAKKKDEINKIQLREKELTLKESYLEKEKELREEHQSAMIDQIRALAQKQDMFTEMIWSKFPDMKATFSREEITDK